MSSSAAPPPAPTIPDHKLLTLVGRGSYGEVWLAQNTLGTRRAVKIVRRQSFDNARPFEREFSGIRRFEPVSREHDGLVDILHAGRDDSGQFFYYIMELADPLPPKAGAPDPAPYQPTTLGAFVERRGRLSTAECLPIFAALTAALAHLHDHGLVHRDIKPSNIIFVGGAAKLADIGLVAEIGDAGSFVGTEGFIAPEGPGSVAADIFALGKVFYEAATGCDRSAFPSLPFTTATELAQDPGLHELNAIILRACAPSPTNRYPTARALLADLLLLQSGGSVQRVRRMELGLARIRRGLIWMGGLTATAVLFFGGLAHRERDLRTRAQNAEASVREQNREAREQLRRAHLAEARAVRLAGIAGRRGRALAALRAAAVIRVDTELQSEAAACLALIDLHTAPLPVAQLPHREARWSWAPNLDRYACALTNGVIEIRSAKTGELLQTRQGSPVESEGLFEFSPQGRWLLCRRSGGAKEVFDLRQPTAAPRVFTERLYAWRFAPDDRHAAWLTTNSVLEVRRVETGDRVVALHPDLPAAGVEFSPDGRSVAVFRGADEFVPAGVRRVEVWNWQSGERTREYTLPTAPTVVAWAANGDLAVALDDFQIRILRHDPTQPDYSITGHQGRITQLQNVPGMNWWQSESWDGTLRLWDAHSGQPIWRWSTTLGALRFHPAGADSIGWDTGAQRWVRGEWVGTGIVRVLAHEKHLGSSGPWLGGFSPDLRWFVSGAGDGLRCWSTETGRAAPAPVPYRDPCAAEFTATGTLRIHAGTILEMDWDPEKAATDTALRTLKTLASGDHEWWQETASHVRAWADAPGEEIEIHVQPADGPIRTLRRPARIPVDLWNRMGHFELSPDARWLALSTRFEHRAWLVAADTGAVREEWPVHFGAIHSFAPDSRRLLLGSDQEYRLWDIPGRSNCWTYARPVAGNLPGREAFSPDQSVVAVAVDRHITALLDGRTGQELLRLEAAAPEVISRFVFSRDGQLLAVLNETGVTHLWSLTRLRQSMEQERFGWPAGLATLGRSAAP